MKEKTYKKFIPYGYIKLAVNPAGGRYMLLSPQPVVNDSWQRDDQQRWAVGVPDFDNAIKVNGIMHPPYTPMHMVIDVSQAVIFFNAYMTEIYLWDGEYADPADAREATMDEVMAESIVEPFLEGEYPEEDEDETVL